MTSPVRPGRRRDRTPVFVVLASLLAGTAGGLGATWLVGGEAHPAAVRTVIQQPAGGVGSQDPGAALPALVARVTGSVVALDMVGGSSGTAGSAPERASGTGFVLEADGLIATTAHVINGAARITVTFADGRRSPATVAGADTVEDLAVLRVARTGLTPLPLAADHDVKVGEFVVATGNALALEGSPTVTVGIISALNRSITLTDGRSLSHLLQTDAAISPGDSGGPLLTASGAVIGINTATASSTAAQNIGFAIPISRAGAMLLRLAGR